MNSNYPLKKDTILIDLLAYLFNHIKNITLMKKPIYLILLTLLSLCFTSSNARNIDSIQTEFMYVTAKSGLNYREEPKGEILGTFGFGQKLAVIEHTKVFGSITNNDKFKNAEWVGIQLDNTIVYAFDFYLSFENPYVYEILSPGSYLTRESDNPTEFINTNWLALHKEDNQYFLGKANYSIDVITDHYSIGQQHLNLYQ